MSRVGPLFFVVGCPRSGTTLLQRMLDAHPDLTVANDTHFIARAVESVLPGRAVPPPVELAARRTELIDWARSYHRFPRLGVDEESVARAAESASSFAHFVGLLYEELARSRGSRWAGDKTPDYVRHLPLLHELFPRARFVHIVRDGRDVALSLRNWATDAKGPGRLPFWGESPIGASALWWQWQVESGTRGAAALPEGSVLELAYEELVRSPETVLRRLADFLEISYRREMATYYEGRERRGADQDAKKAWLRPTPGLRDWRAEMDRADVALFEALAGNTLRARGYELARTELTAEQIRLVDSLQAQWAAHLRRRERKRAARANRTESEEEVPVALA